MDESLSLHRHRVTVCYDVDIRAVIHVDVAEGEPSNGFSVICHGNGLTANGVSKHVASATVDAKWDIHKTPPPSKRLLYLVFDISHRDVHSCAVSLPGLDEQVSDLSQDSTKYMTIMVC